MKTVRTIYLLLSAAIFLAACDTDMMQPSEAQPTLAPQGVGTNLTSFTSIYSLGGGYDKLRTVDIATCDADRYVVAWRNQYDSLNRSDMGDIWYSTTNSGGANWSAAKLLKQRDSSWAYGNVVLHSEGNTVYAFIGRVPTTASSSETQRLIARRSFDCGATWQDVALTLGYTSPTITGGRVLKSGSTYLMPFHRNDSTRLHGVLKSTNLTTWSLAGTVPNSSGAFLQEGFLDFAQGNSKLVMKMRVAAGGVAYSSESSDNGNTWSNAVADTAIPNFNVKGYFDRDANSQYASVFNTAGNRDVLYYRTKKDGSPWGPSSTFANDGGWDTYTMMAEYAPGKYAAVWENNTSNIKFAKLDLSRPFNPVDTGWHTALGWSVSSGGGTATIEPVGQLYLRNQNGGVSRVYTPVAPTGAFTVLFKGKVEDFGPANAATSVSLGTKVATGSKRLMLAVQSDGVYAITSANGWTKVWNNANDTGVHTWKVTVDSGGNAALYRDGSGVLATWTVQNSSVSPTVEHWVTGTSADAAAARIDFTRVY